MIAGPEGLERSWLNSSNIYGGLFSAEWNVLSNPLRQR